MQLFSKSSNKTKLQQRPDQDHLCDPAGCAVDEAPVESNRRDEADPCGQATNKEVFQIDLLGIWQKP